MRFMFWVSGAYLIALLPLLFFYKKLEPKWLRLFLWYILLEYIAQLASTEYSLIYANKSNHFIVNILTVMIHIFYFFVFYMAYKNRRLKQMAIVFAILFTATFLYEILFKKSFFIFANVAHNTGDVMLVISGLLYMAELLVKNEVVNYFKVPMFWITTGLLIATMGILGYICFLDTLIRDKIDANGKVFYTLIIVINYIQYILYAIGFSCNSPWKKNK